MCMSSDCFTRHTQSRLYFITHRQHLPPTASVSSAKCSNTTWACKEEQATESPANRFNSTEISWKLTVLSAALCSSALPFDNNTPLSFSPYFLLLQRRERERGDSQFQSSGDALLIQRAAHRINVDVDDSDINTNSLVGLVG